VDAGCTGGHRDCRRPNEALEKGGRVFWEGAPELQPFQLQQSANLKEMGDRSRRMRRRSTRRLLLRRLIAMCDRLNLSALSVSAEPRLAFECCGRGRDWEVLGDPGRSWDEAVPLCALVRNSDDMLLVSSAKESPGERRLGKVVPCFSFLVSIPLIESSGGPTFRWYNLVLFRLGPLIYFTDYLPFAELVIFQNN